MSRPLYVFDLDGVLVNPGRWFEENPPPKDRKRGDPGYEMWLRRYENWANLNAKPNDEVVRIFDLLADVEDVVILSSRSEKCRSGTKEWIDDHCLQKCNAAYELLLRPQGNFDTYATFKVATLERVAEGRPLVMFDDDPSGDLKVLFEKHPGWVLCQVSGAGRVPGRE